MSNSFEFKRRPTNPNDDGIALNNMAHEDLPKGDPLRTLCDENPSQEAREAVEQLLRAKKTPN